jgi:hypothetical protein
MVGHEGGNQGLAFFQFDSEAIDISAFFKPAMDYSGNWNQQRRSKLVVWLSAFQLW